MANEINRIKKTYNNVYRQNPKNREYIWNPSNPVSIFYRQTQERALINLFYQNKIEPTELKILDVGCGSGGFLHFMANLGTPSKNLFGLDLMSYRIKKAKNICPAKINLRAANAEKIPYKANYFNMVSQFTVFSSVLDPQVKKNIAQEIERVLKRHGYILWYEMRQGNSQNTQGIEFEEIKTLFPKMKIIAKYKLHAPYLSRLAKKSILLAEIWDFLIFFRKTHYLILMQKNKS